MSDRALLVQELERRQAKLLKCQQALKSLVNLRERHQLHAEEAELKREQHTLDEWSQTQSVTQIRTFL
jgi:flagellar export protein FliJ